MSDVNEGGGRGASAEGPSRNRKGRLGTYSKEWMGVGKKAPKYSEEWDKVQAGQAGPPKEEKGKFGSAYSEEFKNSLRAGTAPEKRATPPAGSKAEPKKPSPASAALSADYSRAFDKKRDEEARAEADYDEKVIQERAKES